MYIFWIIDILIVLHLMYDKHQHGLQSLEQVADYDGENLVKDQRDGLLKRVVLICISLLTSCEPENIYSPKEIKRTVK